ncbi:MAG: shikimate kinase [Planctomycetes bacterium]|nr:shikimate kinase [Planctomycetota bacterium]
MNASDERRIVANWNIILIGARGAGKTTVGRALALRLERPFIDIDEWIERFSGRSIRTLFAETGESGFRNLESSVIHRILQQDGQVVSVGGGAVMLRENRDWMHAGGQVLWLKADVEELVRRVASDPRSGGQRPALTALPPLEEMREILSQREPLYEQLADLAVETDSRRPEEIVGQIMAWLEHGPENTNQVTRPPAPPKQP